MIKKALAYNFHDSIVVNCQKEKEDRFSLTLQLYEVFYPSKDILKLVFSGVFNTDVTSRFFLALKADELEPGWNGNRVNAINYDTKRISKAMELYLFLSVDGFEPINIHCKELQIEKQITYDSLPEFMKEWNGSRGWVDCRDCDGYPIGVNDFLNTLKLLKKCEIGMWMTESDMADLENLAIEAKTKGKQLRIVRG